MFLEKEAFTTIIKNTPLISMDIIVKNDSNQVLLGKRVNEPAKDFWFVPGGRIFKDESLDNGFSRTIKEELGILISRSEASFYGLYEHFYDENVFDNSFTTHYIVLAHEIKINELPKLNNQHSHYKWFSIEELLDSDDVHKYAKEYFQ